MQHSIPENISEILLKRLFIFLCLFIIVMATIYFNHSLLFPQGSSFNSADSFYELNKVNVFLNA